MIYDTNVVAARSIEAFSTALNQVIDTYQADGLNVDVQYSPARSLTDGSSVYTALVIARKRPE